MYGMISSINDWIEEFLFILSKSRKTQLALFFSFFSFVLILFIGHYQLSNLELSGPLKGLKNTIINVLSGRYEKLAFISLFSFLVIAYRNYQKDKKKFFQ